MPSARVLTLSIVSSLFFVAIAGCVSLEDGDGPKDPQQAGEDVPQRGSIEGRVVGLLGGVEGAKVELSRVFKSTETGPDGRFSFDGLLPADYRLTVTADHYRRSTIAVPLADGESKTVEINLNAVMLTPDVPAMYGKQARAVYAQDTLWTSFGLPGLLQYSVTNETLEATFPGFWEIEPEPGYRVAGLTVVLVWLPLPEVEQRLGIHYFRGESPVENELAEEVMVGPHLADPVFDGPNFAYYLINNDDWDKWGSRNWQVGAFVTDEDGDPFPGALVEHVVSITVTLVDEAYPGAL